MPIQKFNHVADDHTKAALGIDQAHFQIHRGKYYHTPISIASVASGSTTWVMLKTPDTEKEWHVVFTVQSPLGGLVDFQKNITYTGTTSGSAQGSVCLKLSNTDTGTLSVYLNPTVSNTGTSVVMMNTVVGTSAGSANRIGAIGRQDDEVLLDKTQQHGIRFVSATNQTNVIFTVAHYEVDDR